MVTIHPLLQQQQWRYIDHSNIGLRFNPLMSFAYDDTFCHSVGQQLSDPVIRMWVHAPTVVLGIQDGKLPSLQAGIEFLKQTGYQSIVRNSGGLAVVLDEGILNVSLILQESGIDIQNGYDAMWQLIQLSFHDVRREIKAKEIVGSYCPGRYDLSMDNKKFAGISQRRVRGGIAIQIYICLTGSGRGRAEVIRDFYKRAGQNEGNTASYPTIIPSTMASLSELLQENITTKHVINLLLQTFKKIGANTIGSTTLSPQEQQLFLTNYDRLVKRNERLN